jgi:hypothetical protein
MANRTIEQAICDELIDEIRFIQNQLVFLKVGREFLDLKKMSRDELRETAEALRDQLKRRKNFLGAK